MRSDVTVRHEITNLKKLKATLSAHDGALADGAIHALEWVLNGKDRKSPIHEKLAHHEQPVPKPAAAAKG